MREENNFSKNIPVNGYAYGSYCSAHIAAISHCLWLILQCRRHGFGPWVGKIPWRKEWLSTPVFWPGQFHGLYSEWGHKKSDTTEWLLFSFHLLLWTMLNISKSRKNSIYTSLHPSSSFNSFQLITNLFHLYPSPASLPANCFVF